MHERSDLCFYVPASHSADAATVYSRDSNEPFLQNAQDLGRFVAQFNRYPRSVTGVLRQPTERVRSLTADAYPGTNGQSLQVLWARDFPNQDSVNVQWSICLACLVPAAVCASAYKRYRGKSKASQIGLGATAAEAAAGKEVLVNTPERQETITVKIPACARAGRGKSGSPVEISTSWCM